MQMTQLKADFFSVSLTYRVFYLLLNLKDILFQTFSSRFCQPLTEGKLQLEKKKCDKELKTLCTVRQADICLYFTWCYWLSRESHSCTISHCQHLILTWTSSVFAVWRSRDLLVFKTDLKWKQNKWCCSIS